MVHTRTCYISPYTGKCTSWVGWLTVTQEIWPTQTNMEFSGAGHARSHSESHHYSVVWYSHHLLPHARCYPRCLKLLYAGLHASDAHFYTFSVGIANSFGFISWNIAYTSSNIFLSSIMLVVANQWLSLESWKWHVQAVKQEPRIAVTSV